MYWVDVKCQELIALEWSNISPSRHAEYSVSMSRNYCPGLAIFNRETAVALARAIKHVDISHNSSSCVCQVSNCSSP